MRDEPPFAGRKSTPMTDGRRARDKHEIPDLAAPSSGPKRAFSGAKIPAVRGSVAPAVPSTPPRSARSEEAGTDGFFGAGNFDEDSFGGLDIALDDGHAVSSHPRATGAIALGDADEDGIERTAAGARALPARAAQEIRRWPSGKSPDSASMALDPAEIALIADHGAPPASAALALPYFVRVFGRRRALRARVRELNDRLVATETERDRLLATMVDDGRTLLAAAPEGKRLLEPLDRIESLAGERRTALSGVNAEYDRRAAELDEEEAQLAAAHARSLEEVEKARTAAAGRARTLERAEAKKKRFYIEIRAVLDAVEKAGGQATPEQRTQLAAREADVAAQKPELEAAQRAAAEANTELAAKEATAKDVARRWREVERRKATLGAESQKNLGAHEKGVSEAESHRLHAAVDVAHGILLAQGRLIDVPTATLEGIAAADAKVEEAARNLERHVRSLDAHDPAAYKNGLFAAIAVAASVALLVLVLALR
jgi:hypothetical protein